MKKLNVMMIAITTACGGVLLAGCPKPQETVVVQPPEKVIEKITIKTAPPETVVVKPTPSTPPKTNVKTEVTVNVAPTPTPKLMATPATTPTPKVSPTSTPLPTPRPKPIATPKPTATPRVAVKATSRNLIVRAEVVSTSRVPNPKSVPYKESLVFTKYKILSVESGQYKEKEILVAQWGMKDKKLLAAARNRVGQVQTLSLEPLSNRSELESVMRNDDTNEFELDPYFAN